MCIRDRPQPVAQRVLGHLAVRVVGDEDRGEERVDEERAGDDPERQVHVVLGDPRREVSGQRDSAHPHAEDAQRQPSFRGREPRVDQGDPDRERRPAEAEQESDGQHGRVVVLRRDEQQHRDDRQRRDEGEHQLGAEPVGQRARRDTAQRADQHGHRHQQRLLEGAQIQPVLEGPRQRRDQVPRPEGQREADRGRDQVPEGGGFSPDRGGGLRSGCLHTASQEGRGGRGTTG